MKIAFLILNHRGPAQLTRLLITLRSQLPDAPIVVHHDISHEELPTALPESIDNVHLLASGKPVAWGDYSMIDIYHWSLKWMLKHIQFDWVILLSAQDYPIKPLSGLADDLARNGADVVLRALPINQLARSVDRRDVRRRYLYQYHSTTHRSWVPNDLRRAFRRRMGPLIDVLNIIQPFFKIYRLPDPMPYKFGRRARDVPFGMNSPCWYGSMWFSMRRRAVESVMDYMSDHPDFVDYYRRTIIPDESMLATIVFNSPNLRVENRDVHYTRWTRWQSGHPDTFVLDDLPELFAAPQYFARKFDIGTDSSVLDRLDEFIGAPVSDNQCFTTEGGRP
jgi:hypothetical protein